MTGKQNSGRKPKASTIAENNRATGTALGRLPTTPSYLPQKAKAEWRRMGSLLQEAGLITNLDTAALAAYCLAHAHLVEAEAKLQEEGSVIRGHDGGLVKSPWVTIANQAMIQVVRLLGEFGMTPASRVRLPQGTGPERKPRRVAGAADPSADPREALKWDIQAAKN